MSQVWEIEWPTQSHLLIALKLADYANDDGGKVWPAVSTIAAQAQCSERTVQNVLKAFRNCGLIRTLKPGGGSTPTIYQLNVLLLGKLAGAKARLAGKADAIEMPEEPTETGATVAPLHEAAPVQMERPTGATDGDRGAKLLHPNHHKEPSREPPSPPSPRGCGGRRGREIDDMIFKLRTPERADVFDVLLEPIARRLEIAAPDPAFALGQLADWAARFPRDVLAAARDRVLEKRKATAKPADIEDALKTERKAHEDNAIVATAPIIFEGGPLWKQALVALAAINRLEAEHVRGQGKVTRKHLEKMGVRL
jgi:hypothetical protein